MTWCEIKIIPVRKNALKYLIKVLLGALKSAVKYASPAADLEDFNPLTVCSWGTRQCLFFAVTLLLLRDLSSSDND